MRDNRISAHSTQKEHMPKSHQEHQDCTPTKIIQWAGKIGKSCATVVESIINTRNHPEQGYRSSLGILRLGKRYSEDRLEAACTRAIIIGGKSYKSIKSILEKGLDRNTNLENSQQELNIIHENIRGYQYYSN